MSCTLKAGIYPNPRVLKSLIQSTNQDVSATQIQEATYGNFPQSQSLEQEQAHPLSPPAVLPSAIHH